MIRGGVLINWRNNNNYILGVYFELILILDRVPRVTAGNSSSSLVG
jgi:hypothetical protein